jgi:hypothetical protein
VTEHVEMPHGPMRLETDLRISFLLLNEARYRTLKALFGIPREQANLATLVLVLVWAEGTQRRARQMVSQPPPSPRPGDSALGIAAARELVQSIAGASSRDTSMFGTLVTVAALGGIALPIVRRSMHAARSGVHDFNAAFRHRYGVHAARAAQTASRARERAAETAEKVTQLNLGGGDD